MLCYIGHGCLIRLWMWMIGLQGSYTGFDNIYLRVGNGHAAMCVC